MTDSVDHDDKENNLIQRALPIPNACSGSVAGTEVTSVILLNMDSCNCTPCDSAVSLLTKAELNTLNCEDTNIRNDLLDQKSRIVLVRDRFEFTSLALQQRRDIDRRINLDEMGNVKYLCAGSNSHIFSASWQNQNVIIKTLQQCKVRCSVAVAELNIELDLLSRIDHPNIVKILGAGICPKPFIILERVQDVSQIFNVDRGQLFRRRPFTFLEVIKLAKDFADALRYLHTEIHQDAMIIHRDLKPENLGLSADGSLKLFDFGLCCCVRKRTEDTEVYQMTGNTGSLRYMAPEVVLGKPYTEKVDVFSFAIVIWAIARNEEPFAGFDVLAHRQRVAINGERPAMKNSWPLEFKNLLSDCWHNDSTRRPDFVQIYDRLLKIEEIRKLKTSKQASINSFFRNISISPFGSVKQN